MIQFLKILPEACKIDVQGRNNFLNMIWNKGFPKEEELFYYVFSPRSKKNNISGEKSKENIVHYNKKNLPEVGDLTLWGRKLFE